MSQQQRQLSRRAQTERYVVYVDHQAKSSYQEKDDADREAARISAAFPVVSVEVVDSEQASIKRLGPTQAPPEEESDD